MDLVMRLKLISDYWFNNSYPFLPRVVAWENSKGIHEELPVFVFGALNIYMHVFACSQWYSMCLGVINIKELYKVLLCVDQSLVNQFIWFKIFLPTSASSILEGSICFDWRLVQSLYHHKIIKYVSGWFTSKTSLY